MCGTKLPTVASTPKVEEPKVEPQPSRGESQNTSVREPQPNVTIKAEGAILTNVEALTRKFGCDRNTIERLIEAYIFSSMSRGIRYRLVDASNYRMLNPKSASGMVSLSPRDSWSEHTSLLADYYAFGRMTREECSCFLFIIGGEDIVPMPCVKHYMASHPNFSDKDIDTDIPYAYMLGERTYPLLESGELFSYEQYFHVGRLPFATNASIEDFAGYLRRAAAAADGIAIENYYGQTNMPWGDESAVVCKPLRDAGIPTTSTEFSNSYCESDNERFYVSKSGLIYSLPINIDNLDQVFDNKASFYYFNLHGSDSPAYCGYLADHVGHAILPEHVASIAKPNIFISEACYGGRFQRYAKQESMLLSAMSGETLLFLGSSRIAFCNNRYSIDNSDRLANVFIVEMLNGESAGEALYAARKSFFEYDNGRLYDQQLVSIVEFNLFGDPSLTLRRGGGKHGCRSRRTEAMAKGGVVRVTESKCVYSDKEADNSSSILQLVRREVDDNLRRIRQVIDSELYSKLGVEPRSLKDILLNRFSDGKSFYSFNYSDDRAGYERSYSAITSPEGDIITVITTK